MDNSTNNDNGNGISFSDYPFAWIIVPIFVFFFIGLCLTVLRFRRRRRRAATLQQWPGTPSGRVVGPGGRIIVVSRRGGASRWNPWTRSQEGLNELGEAPPPYEGQKKNGNGEGIEMRDLEAGERPPEYPAAPGPAVTTESRR